jgi:hypothetical protein
MFKKITLVLLMVASGIICNAEEAKNLIPNPNFAKNFVGWFVTQKKAFSVKDNILSVKGLPEIGEKNRYIKCAQNIKLAKDKITGKKFTFGVTVKVTKVTGKLMIAVREIDAKGKSVKYQSINLKKRDNYDWKKLTKTFTASPKTVKFAIYFVATHLGGDDDIQIKDMYLNSVK